MQAATCSAAIPRAPTTRRSIAGATPELDAPDIAASRVGLVHQHEQAMEEMAQAFKEMAQGYASMRDPARFAAAQKEVAEASAKLDRAAGKGASLAKLEPAEKAALSLLVNTQLKRNAAMAAQELTKLMQTPGIKGDFEKLLAAINQAQKQFDREFGSDAPRPSALLIMNKIEDPDQRDIIIKKASALVDRSNGTGSGWGTEGETSRLKLTPVYSAQAFADRINFGKVRRVQGRRIELDVELPSAEEVAQFKAQRSPPQAQPGTPAEPSTSPSPASSPGPGPPPGASPSPPAPAQAVTASSGGASILAFRWLDEASDRIGGMNDAGRPDGTKDQHLVVELELPPQSVIESLAISEGSHNRWVTQPNDKYWPLAVYQGENAVARSYTPQVGTFTAKQAFDLYANNSSGVGPGSTFEVEAVISINGARHTLSSQCKRP